MEFHALQCVAKGYSIALSKPCFELWILLHHEKLLVATTPNTEGVTSRLREVLRGYGKQCCQTLKLTKDMVEAAMERARLMDNEDLLPQVPVARVYKILDAMIAKESIVIA